MNCITDYLFPVLFAKYIMLVEMCEAVTAFVVAGFNKMKIYLKITIFFIVISSF